MSALDIKFMHQLGYYVTLSRQSHGSSPWPANKHPSIPPIEVFACRKTPRGPTRDCPRKKRHVLIINQPMASPNEPETADPPARAPTAKTVCRVSRASQRVKKTVSVRVLDLKLDYTAAEADDSYCGGDHSSRIRIRRRDLCASELAVTAEFRQTSRSLRRRNGLFAHTTNYSQLSRWTSQAATDYTILTWEAASFTAPDSRPSSGTHARSRSGFLGRSRRILRPDHDSAVRSRPGGCQQPRKLFDRLKRRIRELDATQALRCREVRKVPIPGHDLRGRGHSKHYDDVGERPKVVEAASENAQGRRKVSATEDIKWKLEGEMEEFALHQTCKAKGAFVDGRLFVL